MKIWIICTGEKENLSPSRCGAAEFEERSRRAQEEDPGPRQEKKLPWEKGQILIAPTPAARRTAELCVAGGAVTEEALLAPVLAKPWTDRGEHPLWLWRGMAGLQRRLGGKGQPESRREIAARAEKLMARLEEAEKDCVLVADCLLTEELLDRARVRGYTMARTGIFRYRPWERILLTKRDLHCGGCQHNCLLSAPGCGVGRDKAARQKKN